MVAETAYNVIQALPEQEKQRLYKMLSVPEKTIKKAVKKEPILTNSQAREIILKSTKNLQR